MTLEPTLVDVDLGNIDSAPCCGIKNLGHEGRIQKVCWLREHLAMGAHAKVLLRPDQRQCGYIEYVPGEYAWRAVRASGYLFIHCVWTLYKDLQHKGYANRMLQACMQDARETGRKGVAVVAREGPWLAGPDLFVKNGLTVTDTAPPDYQLLVWKADADAAEPCFQGGWEGKLERYGKGLTLIRASQCPHSVKFAGEIAEAAKRDYGLRLRVISLV